MPSRQLTLSHFSVRNASFEDRVVAASSAGFDGVGLYVGAYVRRVADASQAQVDDEMRATLSEHRHTITELEALPFHRDDLLGIFAHIVATFGVERVQMIPPFTGAVDRVAAASWLTLAAERLAPARLAIEFLPPTDVADAAAATELVERSGHTSVGICVDSWHVFRGAGLTSLAGIDPSHVVSLQINDGPERPVLDDYIDDCVHHRLTPGLGCFDLPGFLALLPDDAPIGVEVIDDDLDALDPMEVAFRLVRSVRELVEIAERASG